jgi:hypothetical protein
MFLRYLLDKVTETNPKKGSVYVEKGDAWGGQGYYAKSGKSTDTPTGQTNLVVPTEEVLAWIRDHPDAIRSAVMTYEVVVKGGAANVIRLGIIVGTNCHPLIWPPSSHLF